MDIIDIPRGCGKTSIAINYAKMTGCPIIVANEQSKSDLRFRLLSNNIRDVDVYTIREWLDKKRDIDQTSVIIDELGMTLNSLLDANVDMATLTSKEY